MAEQLTFDLPIRTSRDRGDFFVSEANAAAVARLDSPETWPNGKLILTGPEGAGKSHLAHVWAEERGAVVFSPNDLAGLDVTSVQTGAVIDLGAGSAVGAEAEEALFHLHNHLAAQQLPLLIVARAAPTAWKLSLPDLKSRMEASDVVGIAEPDDALLSAVLLKLFADRQVQVAPNLIDWMVARIDRSFAAAQQAVTALDAVALSEKRAVTRDLARRVLDKTPENGV